MNLPRNRSHAARLRDANGFRADKLGLARRLTVFQEHGEDLLQIVAKLVLGGALRVRSRKAGDVADEQPRIGIALNDGGKRMHAE